MHTIFQTLTAKRQQGEDTVLATIVWDDGSAPRGAGSQMLAGREGLLAGTIGGGAVEGQAIVLAQSLIAGNGGAGCHDFQLRVGGETGMVCGGDVTVLLTPVLANDEGWNDLSLQVLARLETRQAGYLTLPMDGGLPAITEENDSDGKTRFSTALPVGERAVVFGAGHIARALVPLLRTVGFRPLVMDDRAEFTTRERFPQADEVICGQFARLSDYVTLMPEDYVIIMTNGHEHDYQVEEQVLRQEVAYVGVIGSRKKTAYVNGRLREAGISEAAIAFVHTPIGTAIGAVTPEELAVSITGELIAVRAQRRKAAGEQAQGCPMK